MSGQERLVSGHSGAAATGRDPYDAIADQINLTKDQLLVWAGQQVHPDHRRYSELALFHIDGTIDVGRFRAAFAAVVGDHDALRLVIHSGDAWPEQVVTDRDVVLETWDCSAEQDPEGAFRRYLEAWLAVPFATGRPPWRSMLVRRAADRFVWVLLQHQLVSDAWSFGLIFRSLRRHYAAQAPQAGRPSPPRFLDYVRWERRYRRTSAYARSGAYWAEELARGSEGLTFYEGRRGDGCGRVQRVSRDVDALAKKIEGVAARLPGGLGDLNLFAVFCAAATAYAARLSAVRTVVVGVPYANRSSQRFKDTVGTFMHICPLRIEIDPLESAQALVERVRAEAVIVSRHQQYAVRNPMRTPLYDIVVNYQRHVSVARDLGGCPVRIEWPTLGVGNHALAVQISRFESAGGFQVGLDLNEAAFDAPYREPALTHYLGILTDLVQEPCTAVGRLRLEPLPHRRVATRVPDETLSGETLPACVARRVVMHPTRIAVVSGEHSWTYNQLWDAAARVAGHLQSRGIGAGSVVGVAVDRDLQGWTTLLGILASGAAYLPLDRDHPEARIAGIVARARCQALVVSPAGRAVITAALQLIPPATRPTTIAAPDLLESEASRDCAIVGPVATDLFYVIFTSGSSGLPKGILVEHRGMANHAAAKIAELDIGADDRVAQIAPLTFDVSVWQWFTPLCTGGQVHILEDAVVREPRRLLAELARCRITIAATVPSMLRALIETLERTGPDEYDLGALRRLVVTGEILPPDLCRRWLALRPEIPLVNAYGPSECSDDVTHHVIATPPVGSARVPIGTPIANTEVWVLDQARVPVPTGVMGELWIGGVGVARGYLEDPVRTALSFVADPFSDAPGAKLYRTGDLGWRRADGVLEFAGRCDRMTKIRGQRVEPGEVEAVLRQHPDVRDAAVTTPEDATGARRLIAHVVPAAGDSARELDPAALRRFAGQHLPECMIPTPVVVVDRLPVTAHGKIDYPALSVADGRRQQAMGHYVAPRTPMDSALAELWSAVLDVRPIGIDDDFFELGGDSLRAAHLTLRIRERWMIDLPLHRVLDHPTIRRLAAALEPQIAARDSVLGDLLTAAEQMSDAEIAAAMGAAR